MEGSRGRGRGRAGDENRGENSETTHQGDERGVVA